MSDKIGRMESIKKRLIALIKMSIGNIGTVTPDWIVETHYARSLPWVTVYVDPMSLFDMTYGRKTPEDGRFGNVSFTAYIWASACKISGEARNRYAHQHADDIIDYMESRRKLEGVYGIYDIINVSARESEPVGMPKNLSRMIVEGILEIKRMD